MSEENMIPSMSSSQNDNSNQNETPEIDDSQSTNHRIEEVPSTSRETCLVEECIPSTSPGTAIIDTYIMDMIPPNLWADIRVCYSISQNASSGSSSSTISSSNDSGSSNDLATPTFITVDEMENTAYLEHDFSYVQPEISTRFAPPESLYQLQSSTSRETSTITVNRDYPFEFLYNTFVANIPPMFDPEIDEDHFNLTEVESTDLFELLTYGFRSFGGTYADQVPDINSESMKTFELMLNILTQIMGQFGGIGYLITSRSGIRLIETMINVCASGIPDPSYEIKVAFLKCLKNIMILPSGRAFLVKRHKFLITVAELLESNARTNIKYFAMRIIISAIRGTPRDNRYVPVKRLLNCVKKYLEQEDRNSVLARKTMRNLETMVIQPSADTSDDDY